MTFATPLPPDAFSRRMSRLFDENVLIGVATGGQSLFSGPNSTTLYERDATVVRYSIIRGSNTVADLVLRGTESAAVDSSAGVNASKSTIADRQFPIVEDYATVSQDEMTRLIPGEPTFGGLTQSARGRELAAQRLREVIRREYRRMEIMAWESILTGQMSAMTGTSDTALIYNFKRLPSHAVAGAAWTTPATDILGDLDTWWNLNHSDAFINSDILICGDTVIDSIYNNSAIQNFADNRRFGLMDIQFNPMDPRWARMIANGFVYAGTIKTTRNHQFTMFTYQHEHTGSTRYLPIDKMVMTHEAWVTERQFGPGDRLEPSLQERQDYKQYMGIDINSMPQGLNVQTGTTSFDPKWWTFGFRRFEKGFKVIAQIAPLFVPKHTDAVLIATIT